MGGRNGRAGPRTLRRFLDLVAMAAQGLERCDSVATFRDNMAETVAMAAQGLERCDEWMSRRPK
jgi:hypothetical protein